MRLKKIELKNFKKLVDFQAQFSPGINVVKGSLNEMGKSTLLDGIVVALFSNPKSTSKELRDYVSWSSTGQFRTSLEFEDEGDKYLLEKDFSKGTIRLVDEDTQGEIDTFKEISEKMTELLGTDSDRLFLCSSCIRQAQVSEISSGKREITESLEEVVSGGKESTLASQVLQKLDNKIAETKKGVDKLAKSPGILASLKSKLQDTSQRHSEVAGEVSKVEAHKIELMKMGEQLAEVTEQYENAKALLEKNKRRKDIEASVERLSKDYDDIEGLLNKIKSQEKDSNEAVEALMAIEDFGDKQQVLEFRKELDAVQQRCWNIENDLAMRKEDLAEAKKELDRKKYAKWLGSGKSIVAAIIVLLIGIIGTLLEHLHLLGLIILGVVLIIIAMWARATIIRDKATIASIDDRIQRMKKVLSELKEEEQRVLNQAGCDTDAEFNKKEKDFYNWLDRKNAAELQLKGMLGGKTVEEIEEQKMKIARNLATEEANLTDDLKHTYLSPEDYVVLERKVQNLGKRQTELENQKRRCEIIIEQARFNIEDQIKLEEELGNIGEELKDEEKKLKVYELTREFISQARTEILSSVEEVLEKEIQKYLTVFTDGKYKQVRVMKEALEFWVYSDEKRDWAKPDELSGGVIDEFYLAFRLALARLIFGDKKPPLILDDPFVNFDSVRLSNTLKFLQTLAGEYQIIIFTLSDLYSNVADNIILLGENVKPPSSNSR
jgi:DNA repair exonuclease SbcCD ATPase subunit